MNNCSKVPGSFRDPNGHVFKFENKIYRQVNKKYEKNLQLLDKSGLYQSLIEKKYLVPHEQLSIIPNLETKKENVLCFLKPLEIPYISYPYEWSFNQLKDAALLTLNILSTSLEKEMTLSDCSAFNVQFYNGKPIFIDTLSFEKYNEGTPWTGYKQFCQHFLAPLILMSKYDLRMSRLLRAFIDGIPLEIVDNLLGNKVYTSLTLFVHIHLHSKTQKKFADNYSGKSKTVKVSKQSILGIIDNLRSYISKLEAKEIKTEWGSYYNNTNYNDSSFLNKKEIVESFFQHIDIKDFDVWDIGGNTGVFSRIAAKFAKNVLSFDIDPVAVDANYLKMINENETNLLPLVCDLTNPSPGIGWNSIERDSFSSRGPTDVVMALALIHHLSISNNVPFNQLANFLKNISRYLIIEFVSKEDSQVKKLLSSREDIFPHYNLEDFEKEFSKHFNIIKKSHIKDTYRHLFLMEKINN